MKVISLAVSDFRNLMQFTLSPCDGVNVIAGDNAQGKTNLLEALWLFTGARSFRGTRDKDFIRHGSQNCSLRMEFEAQGRIQEAIFRYSAEGRRVVELNGIRQDRPTSLAGVFCAVVFSPDHMSLIKQGPEHRRRMLDVSLAQAYPKYARALENYLRALRQRNTLLKDIGSHPALLELLDVWDKHISDYGGYLSALRAGYVRLLGSHAKEIYAGISGGKEALSLAYRPGLEQWEDSFDLAACRTALAEQLLRQRREDIRAGSTGAGPHRDDLEVLIDGLPARSFGSQGQQRSAILALKLAECEILRERSGEAPVIMLDDVLSELDEGRRNYLLHQLGDKQVIITCCDPAAFLSLSCGAVHEMRAGMLEIMEGTEGDRCERPWDAVPNPAKGSGTL